MEQYKIDHFKDISKLILIFFNIILFFNYVLNTQLTFNTIILTFLIFILLGYLIYKVFDVQRTIKNLYVYLLIFLPLVFNSFFVINFIFSSNSEKEIYNFKYTTTDIGSRREWKKGRSTTIELENNKYSEYYFFRTFFDYEKMKWKTEIIYTFEDGLFGLRVLKDYQFSGSY